MPPLNSGIRIIIGCIAAGAGLVAGLIGNVLAVNIIYFFSRRGRKPTKRPLKIWLAFFISSLVFIILSSVTGFAPTSPVDNISNILRKSVFDAPSDVRTALHNLSKDEFIDLIKGGTDTSGRKYALGNCASKDEFYKWNPSYSEFESRGMLIIKPEIEAGCDKYRFYWSWTSLGVRSYEFVIEIIGNAYGDIRMQVERELKTSASVEIRNSVSGLSKDAFVMLVIYGVDGSNIDQTISGLYCNSTTDDFYGAYPGMAELVNRGLVKFVSQSFMVCPSELFWQITSLGADSHKFVIDIIGESMAKSFH